MIGAPKTYRPDIDGLRAIAVLAVLGFHAFPNFIRGGFVGVDVFFVISGYLITGLLLPEAANPDFRLRDFYARRIRRIFPALTAVLAAVLVVGWYLLLAQEFRQLGKHVVAGAGFSSNLVLWSEAGYFDTAANLKPLLHLWSLGIEEQFYVVFPLVLLACWRRQAGIALVVGSVMLISFLLNVEATGRDPVAAFYAPWTRMWELLAGALLAQQQFARRRLDSADSALAGSTGLYRLGRSLASLAGLLLVAAPMLVFNSSYAFPGWWALLPVAGTVLVISAGPAALPNRHLLAARPLVWVGLMSYPLYLWHWPILKLYLITFGELTTASERLFLIVTSFALAWLTFRFVEVPIRTRPPTRAMVGGLMVAMAGVAVLGVAAAIGAIGPRNTAVGLEKIVIATTDWQFPPPTFRPIWYNGNRFFRQRSNESRTVLFVGDSNVEQYAPRVSELLGEASASYKSIVFATRGGCIPIPDWEPSGIRCAERFRVAMQYAARPEVDTVVFAASWVNLEPVGDPAALLTPLGEAIRGLSRSGKKVYLVLNIPAGPEFDPRRMFGGSRLSQVVPSRSAVPLKRSEFVAAHLALRQELIRQGTSGGATILDPLDYLCRKDICPTMTDDGTPLYIDEHHMRPFHARRDAVFIDQVMQATP